jgi:hypothetical protein
VIRRELSQVSDYIDPSTPEAPPRRARERRPRPPSPDRSISPALALFPLRLSRPVAHSFASRPTDGRKGLRTSKGTRLGRPALDQKRWWWLCQPLMSESTESARARPVPSEAASSIVLRCVAGTSCLRLVVQSARSERAMRGK